MDYFSFAQHAYGLMDRLAVDSAPDVPLIDLVPTQLRGEAHKFPWLVPLHALDDHKRIGVYEELVCAARPDAAPTMPMLLKCGKSTDRVRRHLIGRLLIRLPNQGVAQLRFYDPRVWLQLGWMLPINQMATLFGPVDGVSACFKQCWFLSTRPETTPSTMRLDVAAAARASRIGAINDVLRWLPTPESQHEYQIVSQQIDDLLARAEKYGLGDEVDRVQFAADGMKWHPQLNQHPRIAELLQTLTHERGYRDAAAMLAESDWIRVQDELNHTTEPRTTV